MKLKDIRPQHLNDFYSKLAEDGRRIVKATAKESLSTVIEKGKLGPAAAASLTELRDAGRKISNIQIGKAASISASTVAQMVKGNPVQKGKAEAVASALGYEVSDLFKITDERVDLEPKTIREYHQMISSVLSMAEKEMLVPYNAASRATPPKVQQKEVEFYEPETIKKIKAAFDQEPLKWRLIGYMLVYTGGRRGEVLGLKWENVDLIKKRIHIVNNSLYSADIGIYEETPKTKKSTRYVAIPDNVVSMLKEYKKWQKAEAKRLAGYWKDTDYLFTKDDGTPMHPDSLSDRLEKVEEKYQLPHLHAHAFRHSYVSALIFAGVDATSIAASVGHSKTSTTENIYGHVFAAAEERNAAAILAAYDGEDENES